MDPWSSNYKSHQGNIGLGQAIAFYTSIGIPVMLPLNDTQKYDLVIDKNNTLFRVQVKTTQSMNKNNQYYRVLLKNAGGSSGKSIVRPFDNTSSDILFILTKNGTMYEIPCNVINVKNTLTLTTTWNKYIIKY